MAIKCAIGVYVLLVISAQLTYGMRPEIQQFRRVRAPIGGLGLPIQDAGFVDYKKLTSGLPVGARDIPPKLDVSELTSSAGDVPNIGGLTGRAANNQYSDYVPYGEGVSNLGGIGNAFQTHGLDSVSKGVTNNGGYGYGTGYADSVKSTVYETTQVKNLKETDYVPYGGVSNLGGIGKTFQTHGLDAVSKGVTDGGYGYGTGYTDNLKSTVYQTAQVKETGNAARELQRAVGLDEDADAKPVPTTAGTGILHGRNGLKNPIGTYCSTASSNTILLTFTFKRHYFLLANDRTDFQSLKRIFTGDDNTCFTSRDEPRIELTVSQSGIEHTLHGFDGKSIKVNCSAENQDKRGFMCLGEEGVSFTPHIVDTDNNTYAVIVRCYGNGAQGVTYFSTTSKPLTKEEKESFLAVTDNLGFNSQDIIFAKFPQQ